ncbi:MAG: hypothetical protein WA900_16100 [Casimicrobiaceae bacterium]
MSLRSARKRLVSRGEIPGSNGGVYNPGAVLLGSSIVMLCRREIDYRFTEVVFPEVVTVDPDTLEVCDHRTLRRYGYPPGSRIEDFRLIEFDGMLLAVHSLVQGVRIKPVISRIAENHLELYDTFDLPFETGPVEKNWVLFVRDRRLHCLYSLDPLVILVRDDDGGWELVADTENGWAGAFSQMLSNSANLIPFMGGFLGFWHTRVEGRYVQGAFLLDRDLTLRARTGTLLDGADVVDGYKPGVLYVSALVERAGRVLAFYGEGDAHTGVAVFDSQELERALIASPFERVDPLRLRYEGRTMGDVFRAMRLLQSLAAELDFPPIRLHVDDPQVIAAMRSFRVRNVIVRKPQHGRPSACDYVLSGPAGRLLAQGATEQA